MKTLETLSQETNPALKNLRPIDYTFEDLRVLLGNEIIILDREEEGIEFFFTLIFDDKTYTLAKSQDTQLIYIVGRNFPKIDFIEHSVRTQNRSNLSQLIRLLFQEFVHNVIKEKCN